MQVFESIHCGQTVDSYVREGTRITETTHAAGSHLSMHAHTHPHLAILKEGAYFERTANDAFLRLPGDEVYYPALFVHENIFGRVPARCVNIEEPPAKEQRTKTPLFEAIESCIDNGLVTLSTIAKQVGKHPVYVARVFRATTGLSIGDHLRNERLRRASQLLICSDETLGGIALDSGYYDQSHLTHEFARYAGFSPGELRRLADR